MPTDPEARCLALGRGVVADETLCTELLPPAVISPVSLGIRAPLGIGLRCRLLTLQVEDTAGLAGCRQPQAAACKQLRTEGRGLRCLAFPDGPPGMVGGQPLAEWSENGATTAEVPSESREHRQAMGTPVPVEPLAEVWFPFLAVKAASGLFVLRTFEFPECAHGRAPPTVAAAAAARAFDGRNRLWEPPRAIIHRVGKDGSVRRTLPGRCLGEL